MRITGALKKGYNSIRSANIKLAISVYKKESVMNCVGIRAQGYMGTNV